MKLLTFIIGLVGAGLPTRSLGRAYLMPWMSPGMDRHTTATMNLEAASQVLAERYLEGNQLLQETLDTSKLSLNQLQHSRSYRTGKAKGPLAAGSFIQPILCKINKRIWFILQSGDLKTGLIGQTQGQPLSLDPQQQGDPQQLIATIRRGADLSNPAPSSALKIRLALKRGSNNSTVGQNHCLNLVLSQNLGKRYRMQQVVGTEHTKFLQQVLDIQTQLQRHNRTLHMDWQQKQDGWQVQGDISESVYGQKIYPSIKWQQAPLLGNDLGLTVPDDLQTNLEAEELALNPNEAPRVASIYGAWAYMDKGRAWGLQMKDRVYIDTGDRRVKGHVVGYFGTQKGLRSPLGYPISEGAIVFIRTGQKQVRIGDPLRFDPTEFPAPWPPTRTPLQP